MASNALSMFVTFHPRERHPLIFRELDALSPGDCLVLVSDHDPKPLYYELMAEGPGQLEWTPLEQGPEIWSVRIRRLGTGSEPCTISWLREEHRALAPRIEELAALASRLSPGSWPRESRAVQGALDFLRSHLLPHARLEEEVIYPAVERGLGASEAAAAMVRDYREVEALTVALAEAADGAGARRDKGTVEEAKRLLYSLHAVLRLHSAKEEEVYVPLALSAQGPPAPAYRLPLFPHLAPGGGLGAGAAGPVGDVLSAVGPAVELQRRHPGQPVGRDH